VAEQVESERTQMLARLDRKIIDAKVTRATLCVTLILTPVGAQAEEDQARRAATAQTHRTESLERARTTAETEATQASVVGIPKRERKDR
jgi:hypothetical protein